MPDTQTTPSTSEALFPEFYADPAPQDGPITTPTEPMLKAEPPEPPQPPAPTEPAPDPEPVNARKRDEKGKFVKAAETAAATVEAAKDEVEAPTLEPTQEKKRKVKVSGVEYEVDDAELIKGYQTAKYLTIKGQKLAEQEARLKALEAQLRTTPAPASPAQPAALEGSADWMTEVLKPYVSPLEAKIKELENQLASVTQVTHPVRYQAALDAIDQDMQQIGLKDFKAYVPKIEAHVRGLDPESAEFAEANTPQGYARVYERLKLQELMSQPKPKTSLPDQRPSPKLVAVESGGASPSLSNEGEAMRRQDFEAAKADGSTHAWAKYVAKWTT